MQKKIYIISFQILCCYSVCSIYPQDPITCVQQTRDNKCMYNEFLNQCVETKNQNLGCSNNLNRNACINQLTFGGNIEKKCIFQARCTEVKIFHLKNLGCNNSYSKYACLSVINVDCFWNESCEDSSRISFSDETQEIYQYPVTPQLCAKYQKYPCMNNGLKGDYRCVTIYEKQFKELKCSALGLNELGCRSIITEQEMCFFDNYQCKNVNIFAIIDCSQKLNKLACLSITKQNLTCEWQNGQCQPYMIKEKIQCQDIINVNVNVCAKQEGLCMFEGTSFKQNLDCDTPGITKLTCLSIKNKLCIFYQGQCQTLQDKNLNQYQCSMQLNQAACINITTKGQYCLWDGKECQNVEINQDLDCHLFDKFQVNGNVCQAIIKPNQLCKYNEITKICVESSSNDYCITPYLNLFGCVGIIREGQTCKWVDSVCQQVVIIPFETTCSSLKYANYQACSQSFESLNIGCYFDDQISQCVALQINNKNLEEKQKADQFLASVTCFNKSLGLNKTICGAITTDNTFCRWHQNICKPVEKNDILNVPCIDLKFANQYTCALTKYNNEFCRYFRDENGCINQLNQELRCLDPGLNIISCTQAKDNCYFENNRCRNLGEISSQINPADQIILQNLECLANSPTKPVCLAILTKGQLCQWSNKNQQCSEILILPNKRCSDFQSFQVNANVCASIIMDNPNNIILNKEQSFEEWNPGFCEYDRSKNNCKVKEKDCTDKCCTSNEEIGINAHSCSRFSSQEPGIYCYFKNYRCQELTNLDVDITDPFSVKIYYNVNQFTCAQMNKNSCHMIEWSITQTCYYNGYACVSLDMKDQKDLIEFTKPSAILNVWACLSIEAINSEDPSKKYFVYNQQGRNCKLLQKLEPENEYPKYNICENVIGNSNICLGLTPNLYCKWDKIKLKCVTITQDQQQEIVDCNSYQNIRSCIENQYSACQFSLELDKCIDAPLNQECSYFNNTGQVSQKTCSLINKQGQICEFKDNYCVSSFQAVQGCNLNGINKRGCFKNTKGNCRWDDQSGNCYENRTALEELECNSNLNQILCMKVTKQPCMWNENHFQCVYFNQMTHDQYQQQNPDNQYNEWACTLIIGLGYTYDAQNHKCKLLKDKDNYRCQDIQMNNYACQFLTKGNKCYFDNNEIPPKKKCKIFDMDQSICTTNIAINIDVCMDIPKSCKFSVKTLTCQALIVKEEETCLDLQNFKMRGEYVNKLGCSSISDTIEGNDGDLQCFETDEFKQQCNYLKFCLWKDYTCKVSQQQIHVFDKMHYEISNQSFWMFQTHNCTNETLCGFYVKQEESQENNTKYPGITGNLTCGDGRCDYTNERCSQNDDCLEIYIESLKIMENGSIKQPVRQNQTCQQYCFQQHLKQNYTDKPPLQVIQPAQTQNQTCRGICSKTTTQSCDTADQCNFSNEIKEDCISYSCSYSKEFCKNDDDCKPYIAISWKTVQATLNQKKVYKMIEICKGFYYLQLKCQNIFSKALCLQMTNQQCYFDLNQGGCIQLEGNEHKVPNCNSILNTQIPTNQCDNFSNICKFSGQPNNEYRNTCQAVSQKQLRCKDDIEQNVTDSTCPSITRKFKGCINEINKLEPYFCASITNHSIFTCAGAADKCRFFKDSCISYLDNNQCICDRSYSKSLCEECECVYDLLGYCQKNNLPPQELKDKSNKYYLCYEVNLLATDPENIKIACGLVQQACRYSMKCEDATHYTCDYLLNFVVSQKACTRCEGLSMKYYKTQYCKILDLDIESCYLLNRQGCLQKTKGIMCKWEDYECKEITQITGSDIRDCSIYNREACIEFQHDCWFDLDIGYCTQFDPNKGSCNLLLNEDLCIFSLKESCLWDSNIKICVQNEKQVSDCKELNKYGCLNQQILLCVWSDLYKCLEADFDENADSCKSPIKEFKESFQRSYVTHYSKKICSSIKINLNCFQDNYYQCRETIVTDIIKCDSNGLNRFGCLNRSSGKCQYVDQEQLCKYNLNDQIGCLDSLNKEACISQKLTCKFEKNICSSLLLKNISEILDTNQTYQYSKSVCSSLDNDHLESLIFSEVQKRCLLVSYRQPFIDYCNKFVINKYACLQKTTSPCEYNNLDKTCFATSQVLLKTPLNCFTEKDINWVTCISLFSKCKFINNKCQAINSNDSCESLQNQNAIVNASICATRTDKKCKLNVNSNTCEVIQDNFQQLNIQSYVQCSTPGLNKIGCIFITKGYQCRFSNNQCIFDFGQALCNDFINEDKCYSIKTKGQYCKFDDKGCQQIDNQQGELFKCNHSFKTNPITCSISQDIACYYDKFNKKCIEYSDNYQENVSVNQNWDNKISFNFLACQKYSIDGKKVYWKIQDEQQQPINECYEVQQIDLTMLKCNDRLNESACINIQTPFQFCKYENYLCQSVNLDNLRQNSNCNHFQKVNSGAFCEITSDIPCEFNIFQKACQEVLPESKIDCDFTQTYKKGYNEKACAMNPTDCTFVGACYKNIEQSVALCQDVNQNKIKLCKQIITQGCTFQQNNCKALINNDYNFIKCEEAINAQGCIQIQTPGQTCYYNSKFEECQFKDLMIDFKAKCQEMNQINSFKFCEQTTDRPCKYNLQMNKCEIATENNYDCLRGLNIFACYNLTNKLYQCKFLDYCYGPNNNILECNSNSINDCCLMAPNKEICLFQKKFKCQWNQGCQSYQQINQIDCNQIKNASVNVCSSTKNQFCVFDSQTFACKQIIPQSCDEVQTFDLCNRITNFPCVWNEIQEICTYKEKNIFDECRNIQNQIGNLKACTMIEKFGQKCIFLNNKCQTFQQKEGLNNCTDNLNIFSCLQQTISECEWIIKEVNIKKKKQEIHFEKELIGECQQFIEYDSRACNIYLSYKSCIKIRKNEAFCVWQNNQCQKFYISNYISNENKVLQLVQNINPTVCGLYNDERLISYSEELNSCIEIKDVSILSCATSKFGLNFQSCINIQNELCKWNNIEKLCELIKKEGTNFKISCNLSGLSSKACTLIEVDESCGFIGNGCGKVDRNVNCKHLGLNKFE
ncbi:unnamed protein product [Paramecium sonneborni]|uniref:Transmembrane protein n=1 Tax=Paramecium sonneborni TaxID=65129 RepID=A0A8S1LF94_9CILI|nr:unnamed protein product [Paramecium sonneborni]